MCLDTTKSFYSDDKTDEYCNWTCEDMMYAINYLLVSAIKCFDKLLEFQWERIVLLSLLICFHTAISSNSWLTPRKPPHLITQ